MFLTENKKTDADTDTRGCHTCSITDTSSVTNSVTRGSDSITSGAGSITTGGWWCELERENKQCETGVSYPTESNLVNSNRTSYFTQKLTTTINC